MDKSDIKEYVELTREIIADLETFCKSVDRSNNVVRMVCESAEARIKKAKEILEKEKK